MVELPESEHEVLVVDSAASLSMKELDSNLLTRSGSLQKAILSANTSRLMEINAKVGSTVPESH